MTAVLHGQSLHKSYEDWLVHKTQGPLPAPVLVLDADQGIDNMITTYETYKVKTLSNNNYSNYYWLRLCRKKYEVASRISPLPPVLQTLQLKA